jgi:hypothetical protein
MSKALLIHSHLVRELPHFYRARDPRQCPWLVIRVACYRLPKDRQDEEDTWYDRTTWLG